MANKFQKIIFDISATTPLMIVFAILWYWQKRTILIPVICAVAGMIIAVIALIGFFHCKRKVNVIPINLTGISSQDKWILLYVITYVLPFSNVFIEEINFAIIFIVAFLILLIIAFSDIVLPNPFLFFFGYHTYTVSAENGIENYTLISKKKLRSIKQIKKVKRLSEYYLVAIGD